MNEASASPTTPAKPPLNYQRLIITGRLDLKRAFHIGTGQANLLTDAPIRRDREGRPYIPGSSLAGLLRSAAEEFAPYLCATPAKTIRRLFGSLSRRGEATPGEEFQASCLMVEDAYLCEELSPCEELRSAVEVRDYVGLDRRRAAAREGLQYDREVTPTDTSYRFELAVEKPSPDELRVLLAVLDFWRVCGLQLGGRTTTGLGQAKVAEGSLEFYALDFQQRATLKSFLLDGETNARFIPAKTKKTRAEIEPSAQTLAPSGQPPDDAFLPQHLFVNLELILEEPLLIKGNVPEVLDLAAGANQGQRRTSDAEFITALRRKKVGAAQRFEPELYIPGTSLKGVLRARAEKIIRTLNFYRNYLNLPEAARGAPQTKSRYEDDPNNEAQYGGRIAACAVTHSEDANPRLRACFGNRQLQEELEKRKREAKRRGLRPVEEFEESCVVCRVFGNTVMRGRFTCTEGVLRATPQPKLFDHVAIDRFTGGAADAKKFDTRPLMPVAASAAGGGYAPVFRFQLHLERPQLWMLGLLGHLLKDLSEADMRLGHATRRGYGRVRARVTGARLLALPDSELYAECEKAGLETGLRFATHGPYYDIDLSDWAQLFAATEWGADGLAAPLRGTAGAELLEEADRLFQELVKTGEGQPTFGE